MRIDRGLAPLAAAALWLASSSAFAYCRTTTCDAGGGSSCAPDANGCSTTGFPLYWASKCLGLTTGHENALGALGNPPPLVSPIAARTGSFAWNSAALFDFEWS